MGLCFAPLFSGSAGNCVYVGCGDTRILVDAGKSGLVIATEMEKLGIAPGRLSAIIVTHEHSDHISGVGVLARKYQLPVYATGGSWEGMEGKIGKIPAAQRCVIEPGRDFYLGNLDILPFATPHDANEPVGLCFEHGGARFAIATDIGCPRKGWLNAVRGADAVLLESNYDPDMLKAGKYPYELKRRILSAHGHLSNDDAAAIAPELVSAGTRQIVLGHLSRENNFPELARRCSEDGLRAAGIIPGEDVRLDIASRDGLTGMFEIEAGM